jgi:hypothetical protein
MDDPVEGDVATGVEAGAGIEAVSPGAGALDAGPGSVGLPADPDVAGGSDVGAGWSVVGLAAEGGGTVRSLWQ